LYNLHKECWSEEFSEDVRSSYRRTITLERNFFYKTESPGNTDVSLSEAQKQASDNPILKGLL